MSVPTDARGAKGSQTAHWLLWDRPMRSFGGPPRLGREAAAVWAHAVALRFVDRVAGSAMHPRAGWVTEPLEWNWRRAEMSQSGQIQASNKMQKGGPGATPGGPCPPLRRIPRGGVMVLVTMQGGWNLYGGPQAKYHIRRGVSLAECESRRGPPQ